MADMAFTDAERVYLTEQPLGRLATIGPGGAPQVNPVAFVLKGATIEIGGPSLRRTRKFHNIKADPRISFVVDDNADRPVGPGGQRGRGLEIRGTAEPGTLEAPLMPGFSTEVIRIYPHRIIAWNLDEPGRNARDLAMATADAGHSARQPAAAEDARGGDQPMRMTLRFEIFPSDLDAVVDFYTRVLRFDVTKDQRAEPSPYVSMRRGTVNVGAALGAGPHAARQPPVGVELVLEVDDVVTERDRVAATGWPLEEDLQHRPWGLTDFRILDPAGYYLRITGRT